MAEQVSTNVVTEFMYMKKLVAGQWSFKKINREDSHLYNGWRVTNKADYEKHVAKTA